MVLIVSGPKIKVPPMLYADLLAPETRPLTNPGHSIAPQLSHQQEDSSTNEAKIQEAYCTITSSK